MIEENSGKIYKFKLQFNLGYCYALLIDLSDVSEWDGRMIKVYDVFQNDLSDLSIDEIVERQYLLGAVSINRCPNERVKGAWKYIGKTEKYQKNDFLTKQMHGQFSSLYWWNKRMKWSKGDFINDKILDLNLNHKDVANLETGMVHDKEMIEIKATMFYILRKNLNIGAFYDMELRENMTLFSSIVNTYFSKKESLRLLREVYSDIEVLIE